MREELAKRVNERATFCGVFVRFGKKSGWHGQEKMTVLLKDIVDMENNLICDHIWFNLTKAFASLKLKPGEIVQFDARVAKYIKGYAGYRDDLWFEKPLEIDYKLSRPTKVIKISKGFVKKVTKGEHHD